MDDIIKHIRLDFCVILFRKDGIVEVIFKDQLLLELDQCHELMEVYRQYLGNKKVPILHLIGKYTQRKQVCKKIKPE